MIGETLEVDIDAVKSFVPQWEDIAKRTKYYHIDRYRLFLKISEKFHDGTIECFTCGTQYDLEVHHVDPDESRTDLHGYEHLHMLQRHFEEGKELEIQCNSCHEDIHENYKCNSKDNDVEIKECPDCSTSYLPEESKCTTCGRVLG